MRILALAFALCFTFAPLEAAAAKRKSPNYSHNSKKRKMPSARRAKKRAVRRTGSRYN